ncbi:MAG: TfuA-like protein [Rhizobium sp.]
MRVIFAGPTVHAANLQPSVEYQLRPPARQGDVFRAVQDGAHVIGLIDGVYEDVPAIWHKEILYGLSKGVHTFGAASMGALRAAECSPFGMVGIGQIYEDYASGRLENDSDVAQSHAPADMGYLPLSEALVNVHATLCHCLERCLITEDEHDRLQVAAERIFFKNRTYRQLTRAAIPNVERAGTVLAILKAHSVNLKFDDAQRLIEAVVRTPDQRFDPQFDWTFEATRFWNSSFPPDA